MQYLFTPYKIKNIELKNRIVIPPLASFLIEPGGESPMLPSNTTYDAPVEVRP